MSEYKASETYRNAKTAQAYYARKNTEIINRITFMEKYGIRGSKVKFFKMRNGFFPKMCKQSVQYLLGNGVTLDAEIKDKLGAKFDMDFQRAGLWAVVDGVSWCFWNYDRLITFRATEFVPLFNEETGDLMVGIRFWQIDPQKPINIELYETDGVSRYVASFDGSDMRLTKAKTAYKLTVRRDAISEEVINTENYPRIPVFAFYANELKTSELTEGLKESIDAHDFISSDLADTILQIEGVYWVIKNYGGSDLAQLRDELHQLKMSSNDGGADAGIDNHNVEVPHQAKQVALDLLEAYMYRDTMALDIKAMTGGSLTNIAINVAFTDFDLKTDLFEYQALDVVQNILALLGHAGARVAFKRRTLNNDTENIGNISTMIADGYVDLQWAIEYNPLIADDKQSELLDRVILERTGVPMNDQTLDDDPDPNVTSDG